PRRAPLRPTSDDALIVEVGRGLAGIVVGESSVADALATFGDDCTCSCYDRGSIPGPEVAADPGRPSRIWRISYDFDALERYEPSRPVNARRPSAIEIDGDTGVVKQLDFGVYQRAIATREGLRV